MDSNIHCSLMRSPERPRAHQRLRQELNEGCDTEMAARLCHNVCSELQPVISLFKETLTHRSMPKTLYLLLRISTFYSTFQAIFIAASGRQRWTIMFSSVSMCLCVSKLTHKLHKFEWNSQKVINESTSANQLWIRQQHQL